MPLSESDAVILTVTGAFVQPSLYETWHEGAPESRMTRLVSWNTTVLSLSALLFLPFKMMKIARVCFGMDAPEENVLSDASAALSLVRCTEEISLSTSASLQKRTSTDGTSFSAPSTPSRATDATVEKSISSPPRSTAALRSGSSSPM